ncbi:MAG: dual specificity protein phosphatase family protein [Nitrososphaerota archaeon]|jgi:atypical dual specificity phosphatase|nr:dual specificity protein phosphatase family protein [Nitrososphaerota archaeon]
MGTGGLFLRKLRAQVSNRPTGFVWVEQGRLAGSGYPASRGQVEWASANGIDSVLTLTQDPLPKAWTDGLGLSVEHVPMQDHGIPDVKVLDECARLIEAKLDEGKSVMVHCLAGEGRTGCALAAYLIRSKGLGADEALRRLRERKPEFVELAQERAVSDYAASLKRQPRSLNA